MPVLVAPMSAMLMAHKEGEPATARAAVAANTSMVLSCLPFTLPCRDRTVQVHLMSLIAAAWALQGSCF